MANSLLKETKDESWLLHPGSFFRVFFGDLEIFSSDKKHLSSALVAGAASSYQPKKPREHGAGNAAGGLAGRLLVSSGSWSMFAFSWCCLRCCLRVLLGFMVFFF